MTAPEAENPFLRYRTRLDSYAKAAAAGWSDAAFVALVERLDTAIAAVASQGFRITPCAEFPALAEAVGVSARVHVKDDTGNVGGSHKARHLFGVLLHLALAPQETGELAIASCGNAAVAAATVARAVERPLRVFIPTWADPAVVAILTSLGARIEVSERRPGEEGDPTYLRFTEAVTAGAIPFSVQGSATPATLDGGRTLGWELADQLPPRARIRLFVQVGGGALASAAWKGLSDARPTDDVRLHAVQTEACAPLPRAWRRVTADLGAPSAPDDLSASAAESRSRYAAEAEQLMRRQPDRYMWPWQPVGASAATGILDDVTYDWRTVVGPMIGSGGWPVVVAEDQVLAANELGRAHTGIDADATGTAGLAGLLDSATRATIGPDETVVVLFTGVRRSAQQ